MTTDTLLRHDQAYIVNKIESKVFYLIQECRLGKQVVEVQQGSWMVKAYLELDRIVFVENITITHKYRGDIVSERETINLMSWIKDNLLIRATEKLQRKEYMLKNSLDIIKVSITQNINHKIT